MSGPLHGCGRVAQHFTWAGAVFLVTMYSVVINSTTQVPKFIARVTHPMHAVQFRGNEKMASGASYVIALWKNVENLDVINKYCNITLSRLLNPTSTFLPDIISANI